MKYLTIIVFLFSSIIAAAQLNMEEVSYVPSPSGYYNSLIVKGNVFIKDLKPSSPFNVRTYSSFLNVNVTGSSTTISTLTVTTGTVTMNNITTTTEEPINITLKGGSVSFFPTDTDKSVIVNNFSLTNYSSSNVLNIHTQDLELTENDYHINADFLYLMGMMVPPYDNNVGAEITNNSTINKCTGGYYWQTVPVGDDCYTVLACNTTTCNNPQYEEACLQMGGTWNVVVGSCYCSGISNGTYAHDCFCGKKSCEDDGGSWNSNTCSCGSNN